MLVVTYFEAEIVPEMEGQNERAERGLGFLEPDYLLMCLIEIQARVLQTMGGEGQENAVS